MSLSPPPPPDSFLGTVPEPVQSPFSIEQIAQALLYTHQLSAHLYFPGNPQAATVVHAEAMIHQTRLTSAFIKEKYPDDPATTPSVNDTMKQILASVASISARIDALDKNMTGGKAALELQLNEMRTQTNQRFDDVNNRLGKMDDRITAVDNRVAEVDRSVRALDNTVKVLDNRVVAIDDRTKNAETLLNDHTKQLASMGTKFGTLEHSTGEIKKTTASLALQFDSLKRTVNDLQASVGSLTDKAQVETTVKAIIHTELASLRDDVRVNTQSLNSLHTRLDGIGSTTTDTSRRLLKVERTQCLQINQNNIRNGPWLVISNSTGRDPTAEGTSYPHLENNDVLVRLTDIQLYDYLTFYDLPVSKLPSVGRRGPELGVPRSRWNEETLSAAREMLRIHITTPS